MEIIIGSDHAGKDFRLHLKEYLSSKGFKVEDCGTFKDKANYVTEGIKVAENISMGKGDLGIVICGSGIGISMAANKVKGIRCALIVTEEMAKLAKKHNNANIIALGARINSYEENIKLVEAFLMEKFEGGRHQSRVLSLEDYESSCECL